jgi:hypothetical protein
MYFKINKFLLRIAHLLNFRLDEEHQDDITINISTRYPEDELEELLYHQKENWILHDIINQIYQRFKEDLIFERRCRNVNQVFVTYYKTNNYAGGSTITIIRYIDGVLYSPYDNITYMRQLKINQLLNKKI